MPASDKTVSITINAKDGTKGTFQQIAASSTQMGAAIQTASSRSSAAFDQLRQHAALVGTLLGSEMVRSLQEFAAAGEQNAQAQRQLQQAVTNTGQSYEQYASALEKAAASAAKFGISDDTATNALQALVEQTGSAQEAMNLLGVTEDLAAAKHLSLVDAANLIGKVYNGNTSILKRYGVEVTAGATAQEALSQIQSKFAGQAEANATTLSRFTAEFENFKGRVGEALGPLSSYITLLPGISTGFQLISGLGATVIDMFRAQGAAADVAAVALQAETAAAGEAAVAGEAAAVAEGGLLSTLAGPVGIVALLGAGAAAIYLLTRHTDEYRTAAAAAATDTQKLSAAIATLQAGGGSPTAVASLKAVTDEWVALDAAAAKYREELALANQPLGQSVDPNQPLFTGTNTDAYNAPILAARQYVAEMSQLAAISKADEDSITANLANIFAHPGLDDTKVQAAIDALFASFKAGTIDADGLAKGISDLNANWGDYTVNVASADAATNALSAQVTKLRDSLTSGWQDAVWNQLDTKPVEDAIAHISHSYDSFAGSAQAAVKKILNDVEAGTITAAEGAKRILAVNDILIGSEGAKAAALNSATDAFHGQAAQMQVSSDEISAYNVAAHAQQIAIDAVTKSMAEQKALEGYRGQQAQQQASSDAISAANLQKRAEAANKLNDAYDQMNTASIANGAAGSQAFEAQTQAIAAANAKLQSYIDTLKLTPSFSAVAGAVTGSPAAQLAAGASQASQALGDVYQVIVGGTNAIAQQSDQIMKWADDLIGAEGVYSKLDDLVNKGLISGQSGVFTGNNDYANAQKAYNEIAKDNEKIQEDVLAIQAKQAPVLADLLDKQEQYVASIEKLPADQQLAALGFMDTTESMRAQSLVALAASAAMGQLGDTGKASTEKIIQGAAEADPALEAMLASMGVISQGADGTITVNFPTGETVQSAIDGLKTSIDNLVGLEYTIAVHGDLSAYYASIGGIDGTTVGTVYVNIAPGTVSLPSGGAGSLYQLGGVVRPQSHASGGVASWLAEAGPEFLDFPNGGHGMAYSKGVYSVPEGTYVHTAPATKAMGRGGGAPQNFYGPLILQAASGNLHAELNRSAITRNRRA